MEKQKTIFIVDDSETNLATAKETLKDHYRVLNLPSAARMFDLLEKISPDLILLDIEMPEMDGFEALLRLKNNALHSNIPVIFLTSMADSSIEASGFQLGVVDFITKPFSAPVLMNRIKTHLDIDGIIRERTAKLQRLQNSMVFVIADMVENRDNVTGGHIERTTKYIKILIENMVKKGIYADELSKMEIDSLISSARLHDVGKISISDTILNKPGKLTDEEFEIMKSHSLDGERIIDSAIQRTGDAEFLSKSKMFAAFHHERWNGRGYPYGLSEREIPLQGRIMAVIDVYDALVSERPYKKAFSHAVACEIIEEESGKHFDPLIIKAFVVAKDKISEALAPCV